MLANAHNEVAEALSSLTVIDLTDLRSSINAEIPAVVGELVANAKAKTLRALGERRAAWQVVEPYALASVEKLRSSRLLRDARGD